MFPLDKAATVCSQELLDLCRSNVRKSLKRRMPEIEQITDFGKRSGTAAIVGAGSSLRNTRDGLNRCNAIFAAGSLHDYLIDVMETVPDYAVFCEPYDTVLRYINYPCSFTTYLLASQCHPDVFRRFKDQEVVVWHAANTVPRQWLEDELLDAGWEWYEIVDKPIFGGGNCIGVRAVSLALAFGYRDLHFFGFDCCLSPEGDRYPFERKENDWKKIPIVPVRIGAQGREFMVPADMIIQLRDFEEMMIAADEEGFSVTVHGDGAIAELARLRRCQQTTKELSPCVNSPSLPVT